MKKNRIITILRPFFTFSYHLDSALFRTSVQDFRSFFNQMVCFLIIEFKSSLYIFDSRLLKSDIIFANIFPSLWLVFVLS